MPEIFQLGFMVRAFAGGALVGAVAPILGTFLVLRRLALFVETLAHVALTAVAVGVLLDRFPILVALTVASAAAVLIDWLRASQRLASDSALAVILYTALSLTVVLVGLGPGLNMDLFGFLFGSIVTVREADLWALAALAVTVMAFVWLLYGPLVHSTFDPDLAKVSGVPVRLINVALAVLTAMTAVLAMRVVGALLVGALAIFPALAALQIGRGFRGTLVLSSGLGVLSALSGLTIAYYRDLPAGGAIVLTALALLIGITLAREFHANRPAPRNLQ